MAHEQPGVNVGDATYCAVSGVVFVVEESSPQKRLGDHTYYFCCGSCLSYFEEHANDVLARRGWA